MRTLNWSSAVRGIHCAGLLKTIIMMSSIEQAVFQAYIKVIFKKTFKLLMQSGPKVKVRVLFSNNITFYTKKAQNILKKE